MDDRDILLVIRHHGLGDLMTAQPALRALRRAYPNHWLVTTCPSWLKDLARRLECADEFIQDQPHKGTIGPTNHQAADPDILAKVSVLKGRVDRLISLRTPGPELLPLIDAVAPKHVLSYHYPLLPQAQNSPELDFADPIHIRWARLLNRWDVHPNPKELFLRELQPLNQSAPVIIHTGAGSPARLWPEDRWAEVIQWLAGDGWGVLLTGTERERARITRIAELAQLSEQCIAAGETTACGMLDLVAGAACVVSVDSGIAHLATALRTRAVTLFGPVSPACWGPPAQCTEHMTLWTGQKNNPYGETTDEGLLQIWPQDVTEALRQALSFIRSESHAV